MRGVVVLLSVAAVLVSGCFRRAQPAAYPGAGADPMAGYSDPSFDHSPEELEAFIAQHTAGYEPVGQPIEAALDGFAPWPVQLERGYCYMMVLRLHPGAQFSEHARRGVSFVYEAQGEPQINGGPGVHGPGAVASAGCPQRSVHATFDVRAIFGSATDTSRVHELGSGKIIAQLVAKPITEEQLAALEADTQRQIAEAEAFNRQQDELERQRAAEREREWAEQRERDRSAGSQPAHSGPAHAGPVSVTLRNGCRETVRIFFGDDPRFGSGTHSTLSSNTVTSRSFQEGDTVWLTDESRNGLSSVTISRGTRQIEVTPSCTGFVSR